jgi:hypothetical protein
LAKKLKKKNSFDERKMERIDQKHGPVEHKKTVTNQLRQRNWISKAVDTMLHAC